MSSTELGHRFLAKLGAEYESLSFDELLELQGKADKYGTIEGTETFEDTEMIFSIMLGIIEGRRRRITVEIMAEEMHGPLKPYGRCHYFERYACGKIDRCDKFTWHSALDTSLKLGLFFIVAAGLVFGLVWCAMMLIRYIL